MACCVAANRTVQKLHRKEFVCRFLWLFLFGFLDGEGAGKECHGRIQKLFHWTQYLLQRWNPSISRKGHIQPVHWKKIFVAEMGERQKTRRKPQKMWLLPLFVTSLQAEKCCHILLLVYKCTLIVCNRILPYFSPGFTLQFCHCLFRLIPCFCSPECLTCSLPVHHFILPHFVQGVISFKNMNNHGYFFLFSFSGKWPFLLLSHWWMISKPQLSKVVFVAQFLSKNLEVFSSLEFVQHLSRRFEIGKVGFNLNRTIISFLWFLWFSLAFLRCPEIRS